MGYMIGEALWILTTVVYVVVLVNYQVDDDVQFESDDEMISKEAVLWGAYGVVFGVVQLMMMIVYCKSRGKVNACTFIPYYTYWAEEKNREDKVKKMVLSRIGLQAAIINVFILALTLGLTEGVLRRDTDEKILVAAIVPGTLILLAVSFFSLCLLTRSFESVPESVKEEYAEEGGHHYYCHGLCYYNKQDTRVFVHKKVGYGWTINTADYRGMALIFFLVVIIPVVVVATALEESGLD